MEIGDYIRSWSNQQIRTEFESVDISIEIKDRKCSMILEGKAETVKKAFYIVWEVLFLYDGYFYSPLKLTIDDEEKNIDDLIRVAFYKSGRQWISSAILLGRAERNLSENVLKKFDKMRNEGKENEKMTKSVVNAFFYLHSDGYEKINEDHRLSLYLNVCDGFVNNTYKETKNVKTNFERVIKRALDADRILYGLKLMGMNRDDFCYVLAQERNEVDHYIYKKDSIATHMFKSEDDAKYYISWYFTYVVELALRISFLDYLGVEIKKEHKDYAMDLINDWVIFENGFDEKCATPYYQLKQSKYRLV
ncbi:MAG: hypothetical protein NC302_08055 [Bacteroidales bacterium]|nr:hypothetical protein [Bacteroidales bacterium]MCM1424371.1 hypothetical protein [bacterium]